MTKNTNYVLCQVFFISIVTGFFCSTQAYNDQEVFQKILRAAGVGRKVQPPPTLSQPYTSRASVGAQITKSSPQLVLERRLRAVCKSFGATQEPKALAFVMGQQLALYYLKKEVPFLPKNAQAKLEVLAADRLGMIYAHMAGFDVVELVPQILAQAYQSYGKANDDLYQKRLSYYQQNKRGLRQFFLTFETANLLVLINENLGARSCYEYILTQYQGREVYNNAGVNLFKVLLRKFTLDNRKPKFLYPVALGGNTRLTRSNSNNKGFDKVDIRKVYNSAAYYLKQAIKADPEYAPAYHNLACLQALRKRWSVAKQHNAIALKLAQKLPQYRSISRQVKTVQAIIAYHQANNDPAKQAQAAKQLHQLKTNDKTDDVYLNWSIMKGYRIDEILNPEEHIGGREVMCGINLREPQTRGNDAAYRTGNTRLIEQAELYVNNSGLDFRIFRERLGQCEAEKIVFVHAGRLFYFLRALPSYQGVAGLGKVKINQSTWANISIKDHYGLPKSRHEGTPYSYKIYHGRQIIFALNQNDILKEWVLYYEVK
jgi:hypothetical protein